MLVDLLDDLIFKPLTLLVFSDFTPFILGDLELDILLVDEDFDNLLLEP